MEAERTILLIGPEQLIREYVREHKPEHWSRIRDAHQLRGINGPLRGGEFDLHILGDHRLLPKDFICYARYRGFDV